MLFPGGGVVSHELGIPAHIDPSSYLSLTQLLARWLTPSLTHSLTPSLPHSLTRSLTHSLTHSLQWEGKIIVEGNVFGNTSLPDPLNYNTASCRASGEGAHSLTCSLAYPFTRSPTNSLTHRPTFSRTRSRRCLTPSTTTPRVAHSLAYQFIFAYSTRSLARSLTDAPAHSLTHSLTHAPAHFFTQPLTTLPDPVKYNEAGFRASEGTRSLAYPFTRSPTHSLTHRPTFARNRSRPCLTPSSTTRRVAAPAKVLAH